MQKLLAALVFLGASMVSFAWAHEALVLDDFEDVSAWRADASDGVDAAAAPVDGRDGGALRFDFDFHDVSGYAFVGRALPIRFPENFEISFWMRADAPVNTLEVKFTDASGENVWWRHLSNYAFPREWTRVTIRKRQVDFAWGPIADRTLRETERMEFVVTRGEGGGRGSVYIDGLRIRELPPADAPLIPVEITASRTARHSSPHLAVDGVARTAWRAPMGRRTITFDLGAPREFGGVELRWEDGGEASDYDVLVSDDARVWRQLRSVVDGDGGRDPLLTTESEARYVRLALRRGPGRAYALSEFTLHPPAWGENANTYVEAVAAEATRGVFPRGFLEQSYWTLIGADGAADNALIGEDGAVEIGQGGFSVEPFVRSGGRMFSWADVEVTQSLAEAYLPIPSVHWRGPSWTLIATAFVDGDATQSTLLTRYDVANTTDAPLTLDLILAARPFQVNGPRQFLNRAGGVSPVSQVTFADGALVVNGRARLWPSRAPDEFSASRFDSGIAPFAAQGGQSVRDETGLASGALTYRLTLAPGESRSIAFAAPLTGAEQAHVGDVDAREAAVAETWRARLGAVDIRVPQAGQHVVDTIRSSLAHILMSREDAALKPGTRSYDRSWIRDGAMIAEGLIRLGAPEEAAAYLRWFAPYQFENGKVPCCVDSRGADPTPENDSHGEFIFLAAEVWRETHDEALLREVWPRIIAAVDYMDALRASETEKNASPERRHLYGLMPPSISHEGYSARPAYSHWDNFWALLGYKEAVVLAEAMGDEEAARRFRASRDEFRRDLYASLAAMRAVHGIDFIPGAADLGDFDATSTTIALTPGGEGVSLPRAQLEATFERYWREFVARRDGARAWEDYTPYEIRTVGAFVRLGWRERAQSLLAFFLADRRPQAWNGWAEVVGRDPREHRFIGDMPHAWISSDFIRSALELFVYRREQDEALVLAAGVPAEWLNGEGVAVRGLRTAYGGISYSLRREGEELVLNVEGDTPPGGYVLPWPLERPPGAARFNGRRLRPHGDAFVLNRAGELRVRLR